MSKRIVLVTSAAALLCGACAWVSLEPAAESVRVRSQGDVTGCERLGKTHTRTMDRIGFIPRRASRVHQELERLARNEAVNMGGNAVAPLGDALSGEQDYGIYRCP